jgi:hypothetical protein
MGKMQSYWLLNEVVHIVTTAFKWLIHNTAIWNVYSYCVRTFQNATAMHTTDICV